MGVTQLASISGGSNFEEDFRTVNQLIDIIVRPRTRASDNAEQAAVESLNSAVNAYNRYSWPFFRSQLITMVADQPDYGVNQRVRKPIALYEVDDNELDTRRVYWESFGKWVNRARHDENSSPRIYTIENLTDTGEIKLHPTPGTAEAGKKYRLYFYPRIRSAQLKYGNRGLGTTPEITQGVLDWARMEFASMMPGAESARKLPWLTQHAKMTRAELVADVEISGDTLSVEHY